MLLRFFVIIMLCYFVVSCGGDILTPELKDILQEEHDEAGQDRKEHEEEEGGDKEGEQDEAPIAKKPNNEVQDKEGQDKKEVKPQATQPTVAEINEILKGFGVSKTAGGFHPAGKQRNDIDNEHIKYIAHHKPEFSDISLFCSSVDDTGLKGLKGLQELKLLVLSFTNITGAGLGHLKGLASLTTLKLNNIKLEKGDLDNLKGLNLRSLELYGTGITEADLKELKDEYAGRSKTIRIQTGKISPLDEKEASCPKVLALLKTLPKP